MDKRNRAKLKQKLSGFEYRQRARDQQRAARQKAYRITAMMREQGTLRGARKYLDLKGVPYREAVDPASGDTAITIPDQVTLCYDANGRFLAGRPPKSG